MPDQSDDVVFTPKVGQGWEIARNWTSNKNASFMAYGMTLAQLLPPYPTIAAHWPASALLWGGWWRNDGVPVYVGMFTNLPEDDGDIGATHPGWLRLSWNPDGSLTLYDWAYETEHDTPIVAGAIPEPRPWRFLAFSLVCLLALRRKRS
jgi:hypothetical protein